LRTASALTRADRRLTLEAIRGAAGRTLRSLLPLRVLARHMGGIVALYSRYAPPALLLSAQTDRVFAIGVVAPWMPFRTLCL
jgi:hypothetical protein